jgi:KUP system potassium uptake protein
VHNLGADFYQVVLRFGFMDEPDVPGALATITSHDFGFDGTDAVYFLGKETVIATDAPGMATWRDRLFVVMHRNAVSAAHHFRLPPDQTFEVGVHVEI